MNPKEFLPVSKARRPGALCAALSFGIVFAISSATADQIATAPSFGPFQVGNGGEYTVIPDTAIAALVSPGYSPDNRDWIVPGSFQTFCVEYSEHISAPTTYDVTLDTTTHLTGMPLTVGAAYLYQQFATGALPYNYAGTGDGTRKGSASIHYSAYELQRALWYFMGSAAYDAGNVYLNGTVLLPGGNLFAPDNGAHGVFVLNLWGVGGVGDPQQAHQDILVYTTVPEPGMFSLAGLGTAALLFFRRRM